MRTLALLGCLCLAVSCKRDAGPHSVSDQWRLLDEQREQPTPAPSGATIVGIVEDPQSHRPHDLAVVSLSCTCLDTPLETFTNVRGIYVFRGLPAGDYTVTVDTEAEQASQIATIEGEATHRVNFQMEHDDTSELIIDARPTADAHACIFYASGCRCGPTRQQARAQRREHRRARR